MTQQTEVFGKFQVMTLQRPVSRGSCSCHQYTCTATSGIQLLLPWQDQGLPGLLLMCSEDVGFLKYET